MGIRGSVGDGAGKVINRKSLLLITSKEVREVSALREEKKSVATVIFSEE